MNIRNVIVILIGVTLTVALIMGNVHIVYIV